MQIRRSLLALALIALAACLPAKNAADPDGSAMSQGAAARSAQPVMEDGVTMKGGMMLEIKDGQMSRMQEDLEYDDGTTVKTDGTVILSDGTTLVLPEGMMITADGRLQMREDLAVPPAAVITAPPSSDGASSAAVLRKR